jgi:urease accessory protein
MGTWIVPELDAANRLDTGPDPEDSAQAAVPLLWLTRRIPAGTWESAAAHEGAAPLSSLAVLCLSYDLRSRSRLKARLEDGRPVGIVLPRGNVVRGGDLLLGPALGARVVAAEEDVIDAHAQDPAHLVRAAYHLGNRHVPVQLAVSGLRLGWDSVLADMLIGLGLAIQRRRAPFEPEAGAYAHR